MSIKLNWVNQSQLSVHVTFPQTTSENDWYNATSQLCVMLNSVDYPINVILDMSALDVLPFDIIASINAGRSRIHPNHGAQVIVVKPSLRRPMSALLRDTNLMTGSHVVTSLDEAKHAFANMMVLDKIS